MALLSCVCLRTADAQVTLTWDASPEPGVSGYTVYRGTSSGTYTPLLDAGTNTAAVPDPPANATHYFVVKAYNTDGLESEPSDEIRVRAPSISSSPNTFVVANALYSYDVNASGDPPPAYALVTAPAGMTINATTGVIQWTPSTAGSFPVTVTASNSVASDATQSFTVSVSPPPNQPPTISAISDLTISEDTSTGPIPFIIGDAETPVTSLTVTSGSSNLPLIPNANVVVGGSGANRTVTITPLPNKHGSSLIALQVRDASSPATLLFTVTVTPVNDVPVATPQTAVVEQDGSVSVTLSGSDADGDPLSYAIAGAPAHGTLSGSAPNLTYTPAPRFNGIDSFTFTVSDGATVSAAATVSITVTAESPWTLIALTGEDAPGTGGAHFTSFSSLVRSDRDGDAAFLGNLDSAPGTASAVWAETNGALEIVARQGSAAPGVTGGVFDVLTNSPWWSGSGHLFLHARLLNGTGGVSTSNDYGLWYKSPTAPLELIARENDQAPGLPAGSLFAQIAGVYPGDNNLYAFTATLKTGKKININSNDDSGIWANFSGTPSLLVREGAAPGTPSGVQFNTFTNAVVSVNSTGQLAFRTLLKLTTGVTDSNKFGVWMWDGTRLAKVVRGGELAPGTATGVQFLKPGTPLLRDSLLVFQSTLALAGGVTSNDDTGVWKLENGAITLLAREGSAAPGGPSGSVFSQLAETVAGNDDGALIYRAAMRAGVGGVFSTNNDGIWARTPATANVFTLIAREGIQAPQAPAGAVFSTFDAPVVTGGGREVFTATLLAGAGGVTTSNDRGLWVRAADGQLTLALREGGPLSVPGLEAFMVSDIILNSTPDTASAAFSEGNSFKALVRFTNGKSAVLSFDPS